MVAASCAKAQALRVSAYGAGWVLGPKLERERGGGGRKALFTK